MNTLTCLAEALVHLPMWLFADRDGQRAEWWAALAYCLRVKSADLAIEPLLIVDKVVKLIVYSIFSPYLNLVGLRPQITA